MHISVTIRVVEFSNWGTQLERFLPKNQHTQRKFKMFKTFNNEIASCQKWVEINAII